MAKEEIRDILSMSKKDQKKWLKETESIVEDLKGGADKGYQFKARQYRQ